MIHQPPKLHVMVNVILGKVSAPQAMECLKCNERRQYILNPNTD